MKENKPNRLLNELQTRASWVLSLVGPGGSGKTHAALWILENWFPEDRIAIYHYDKQALAALPEHIRKRAFSYTDYSELLGKKCIVLMDDTALFFLSRSTGKTENKDMISNSTIARQNDLRFISTAQNTILVDKGLYEALDQFQLRSVMTHSQAVTERPDMIEQQLMINEFLEDAAKGKPREYARGLRYCPETGERLHFPAIPWMTEQISKPYKGCYVKDGELLRPITKTHS